MSERMHKYPRTRHVEGSRLQPGDEDLDAAPLSELHGRHVVVEEKVDGANAGVSFTRDGELRLQSRGHFLIGGGRERHFNLLKSWASRHADALYEVLGWRYVLYGEWLYAKHTIFYDALPHYFLEFDVLDVETGVFLSTTARRSLLAGLPVASVPVLHEGSVRSREELDGLIRPSLFKTPRWQERLLEVARREALDEARVRDETDRHDESEGLYLKVEEGGSVRARYKYVRPSFLTSVLDSGTHWLSRPIVPNQLRDDVDLFAGAPR